MLDAARGKFHSRDSWRPTGLLSIAFFTLTVTLWSGCAALTNPVANGIPVRLVPPELLGGPRQEELQTIPLSLLKRARPDVYRLAANDVLGIYIEGVLPAVVPNQPQNPPVYFPSQIDPLARGLPPSMGYPIPVRDDGTVALPLIGPLQVSGMSLSQVEAALRREYVGRGYLQPGTERIFVSLMQPRMVRVTVIRQESGGFTSGGLGGIVAASSKRSTGHVVNLRCDDNDVLTALAETGGLPGLDAYNSVIIFKKADGNPTLIQTLESLPAGQEPASATASCPCVIEIPLRRYPCEQISHRPEDVILENGDVVFVEARDVELFYTGGILPPGEYPLPRDYDLDVVEAVMKVQGSLVNGSFSPNQFTGFSVQRGIGNPNPSLLTVIRRTPNGGQVAIRVDMNRALRDPRERILVRPGDVLILQETPGEAVARYFSEAFRLSIVAQFIQAGSAAGAASFTTPTTF